MGSVIRTAGIVGLRIAVRALTKTSDATLDKEELVDVGDKLKLLP